MTREEAISYLEDAKHNLPYKYGQALDMATESLSADAEPTVIRSRTLLPTKDFKEWARRIKEVNPNAVVIPCDAEVVSADAVHGVGRYEKAMQKLREMPRYLNGVKAKQITKVSADAVHGEWEHWGSPFSDESEVIDTIVCSVCGARFIEPKDEPKGEYNFCPNCGAKMDKGGDTE